MPMDCWSLRGCWRPKRVVVKRPDYAPPLANVATPNAVVTKGHRFDIYAGTPV